MCSDHATSVPVASETHHDGVLSQGGKPHLERRSVESQSLDLEKEGMTISTSPPPHTLNLSHYRLVEEVWHYCSVDWSNKCTENRGSLLNKLTAQTDLCIGYNSLSDTRRDSDYQSTCTDEDDSESTKHVKDKPKGARTWTWVSTASWQGLLVVVHSMGREKYSGSRTLSKISLDRFTTQIFALTIQC